MRWFLFVAIVSALFTLPACTVNVEEKPAPVAKPVRTVDVDVDAPGVDVKVNK
jgi:hypothetical protein